MIYLTIVVVLLLVVMFKIFFHIEKRHDQAMKKVDDINESVYSELSDKKKEIEVLKDKVRFIENFIKEDESIGNEENRKKLEYRLTEAFLKSMGKTKFEFDKDNIEHFCKKTKMSDEYKADLLAKAKEEEQKYSAYTNNEF